MILPDHKIRDRLTNSFSDDLSIEPITDLDKQLQPASFDLFIGNNSATRTNDVECSDIRIARDVPYERAMYGEPPETLENCPVEEEYGKQHWVIPSQTFALGTSREAINMPDDLVADVEGRSTTGRTGLIIHATAGFIDPGFYGEITFEMFNLRDCPIKVPFDTRIGQMIFYEMASRPERPYGERRKSKYQNQFGPTPAKSDT